MDSKEQCELVEVEDVTGPQSLRKYRGTDGITADFWEKFKNILSPLLLEVFRHAYYQINALPSSFSWTHTFLIPKSEDVDKIKFVTRYRPMLTIG